MKVLKMEETSPTKRKLTLQIEPDDLNEEAEEAYTELAKAAEIPGFRKGHVPRKFLEYRFDKTIQKEAFADAVQKALEDAAKEKEFEPVGRPDFDESEFEAAMEKAGEEPVEVSVTVEVVPDFELSEYKGLKLEVEKYEVDEAAIDRLLERQRENQAYYVAIDDRPVQKGDYVLIESKAKKGDDVFEPFTLDRMTVPNVGGGGNMPAFDEPLIGRKKGERFEYEVEFDEDFPLYEEDGDNKVQVSAKILQINERMVPDLDDEFAKDIGFSDLAEYRNRAKERLTELADDTVEGRKKDKVVAHLLDKADFSVPTSLIQSNYLRLKYARQMEAAEHGDDEAHLSSEQKSELEQTTMYQAEQIAKRRLVLAKIAKAEGLEVDDDEYFEAMKERAKASGEENVDKFLADIDKRGLEATYKENLLLDKVVDWLAANNEFEIVSPKPAKKKAAKKTAKKK